MFTEKTSWYSTIRGRVGTSTGPALLYFTGGVAFVNYQNGATLGTTSSKTGSGWTFGGGTELALDAHWSAKIESLYVNAGSTTQQAISPPFAAPVVFKNRFGIVRAGLNYALN